MDETNSRRFRALLAGFERNPVFTHMHPRDLFSRWLDAVWALLDLPINPQAYRSELDGFTFSQGQELGRLFNLYLETVEELPFTDILGPLFMRLDSRSARSGQYFTPAPVAEMMARMSVAHTLRPPSTMAQARTSARRLWRTMKPDTRTGISQAGIMRGLKSLGIHASMRRNLTFGEIRRLVDGGYPVITAVRTRTPDVHHWTVIHGYSVNPGRIYLSNTLLVRGLAQAQHWPEFRRKVWADPGYGIVCRR